MDLLYLQFCHTGEVYYDHIGNDDRADVFEVHAMPEPDGWERLWRSEWVTYRPIGSDLPPQGWKLHISATNATADKVISETMRLCITAGVQFKTLRSSTELDRRNSKYADRGGSGKFVTIYPPNDALLSRLLHELDEALGGLPGPYILTDCRWNAGPIYFRYGAFVSMTTIDENGRSIMCIRDESGALVEDERKPGFRIPGWVTPPVVLSDAIEARSAGRLEDFPYVVDRALHFSNGGGVYAAHRIDDGTKVLLKEARPHAGMDESGVPATTRLDREWSALEAMVDIEGIPNPDQRIVGREHTFIARQFVDGEPLFTKVLENNPVVNPRSTMPRGEYAAWARKIMASIEALLARVHEHSILFADLHFGNVLVDENDSVHFIDFEASTAIDDPRAQAMGAIGFRAPAGYAGTAIDHYGLGCIRLAMLVPITRLLTTSPNNREALVAFASAEFGDLRGYFDPLDAELGLPAMPVDEPIDKVSREVAASYTRLSATLNRDDRLYPGDIRQFIEPAGGVGFKYGAAGVVWALAAAGELIPTDHTDWIESAVRRNKDPMDSGFWSGTMGAAYALHSAGRSTGLAMAVESAERFLAEPIDVELPWMGLACLALAKAHSGSAASASLLEAADTLGAAIRDAEDDFISPGLLTGGSARALFAVAMSRRSHRDEFLDVARRGVKADLSWFASTGSHTGVLPALGHTMATGEIGVGYALAHLCVEDSTDPSLRSEFDRLYEAAQHCVVSNGGLLNGLAGVVEFVEHARYTELVDHHGVSANALRERLRAFAVRRDDRIDVLGDQNLRFSCDYATGLAGLAALDSADSGRRGRRRALPLLDECFPAPEDAGHPDMVTH